jgi:hypothetical protein
MTAQPDARSRPTLKIAMGVTIRIAREEDLKLLSQLEQLHRPNGHTDAAAAGDR